MYFLHNEEKLCILFEIFYGGNMLNLLTRIVTMDSQTVWRQGGESYFFMGILWQN